MTLFAPFEKAVIGGLALRLATRDAPGRLPAATRCFCYSARPSAHRPARRPNVSPQVFSWDGIVSLWNNDDSKFSLQFAIF
jgi:hypothetical protein